MRWRVSQSMGNEALWLQDSTITDGGGVQPAGTWLWTSTEVMVVLILVRLVTCPTVGL